MMKGFVDQNRSCLRENSPDRVNSATGLQGDTWGLGDLTEMALKETYRTAMTSLSAGAALPSKQRWLMAHKAISH